MNPNKWLRAALVTALLLSSLMLSGCSGNVGVGLSVGVPVGSNGYLHVGTSTRRWH
jgi:hypothetical protein